MESVQRKEAGVAAERLLMSRDRDASRKVSRHPKNERLHELRDAVVIDLSGRHTGCHRIGLARADADALIRDHGAEAYREAPSAPRTHDARLRLTTLGDELRRRLSAKPERRSMRLKPASMRGGAEGAAGRRVKDSACL